ncbi:hypothetical protein D3C87_182260 [compost metagenome]
MIVNKNTPILKLYPNVIPVKGYNRSLLVDLLKGKPYLVPNDLIDYLEQVPGEEVKEYEKFILDNELGICIDPELGTCLTPLPTAYHPVSKLNNAILELDEHSSWNIPAVLEQLDQLGTQFLEVRFLDYDSMLKNLSTLQKYTEETTIESIQLLIPFNNNLKHFLDSALYKRFFRLNTLVIYNAPSGFELKEPAYNLVFTRQKSVSHEYCGNISPESFAINTQAYARNRNYNSCLAHKMSIDKEGFICNCPSTNTKYGHSDSVSLYEVLANKQFREKWELTKDKLLVCSVCEFRWICSDCRAFTLDDLENGKPSKCGYNPFINLWSDDEHYLPEKDCGISFQDGQIQIEAEKLDQLNAQLWN